MALKINLPESRVQVSHTQNLFPGLELKCLNVGQEKAHAPKLSFYISWHLSMDFLKPQASA